MAAALAVTVFGALLAKGAYGPVAVGVFGVASLVAAASALLLGLVPARAASLGAAAFVGLGAWSLASTAWGGLPAVGLGFAGLMVVAAACLLLGSCLARWETATITGLVLGLAAHAAMTLAVVGVGAFPSGWFVERQLEGSVGYHNALGTAYAMGIPLAVWLAGRQHGRGTPFGGFAAAVLIAGTLLTQSRGALLAIALTAVIQVSVSRTGIVTAIWAVLGLLTALLFVPLRAVDAALVEVFAGDLPPAQPPLARYAVAAFAGAAAVAALTAFFPRLRLGAHARRILRVVVVVAVATGLAASAAVVATRSTELLDRLQAGPNSPSQTPAGATRLSSLSPTGRVQLWRVAWVMIDEEPLGGHGVGSFARRWSLERDNKDFNVLRPHSIELETLSELGIVGGALLALALGSLGWLGVTATRRHRELGAASILTVLPFLLMSSVDWVFSFPLLLGVTVLVCGCAEGSGTGRPIPTNVCILGLVVGVAVLSAPAVSAWYLGRARAAEDRSLTEAADLADRAWMFNRWDPDVSSFQAELSERTGAFAAAAERYGRAAALSRQPWLDTYRRARALHEAGRAGASRRACVAAIRSNPLEPSLRSGVCDRVDAG